MLNLEKGTDPLRTWPIWVIKDSSVCLTTWLYNNWGCEIEASIFSGKQNENNNISIGLY